jgi:hypothetical protein
MKKVGNRDTVFLIRIVTIFLDGHVGNSQVKHTLLNAVLNIKGIPYLLTSKSILYVRPLLPGLVVDDFRQTVPVSTADAALCITLG